MESTRSIRRRLGIPFKITPVHHINQSPSLEQFKSRCTGHSVPEEEQQEEGRRTTTRSALLVLLLAIQVFSMATKWNVLAITQHREHLFRSSQPILSKCEKKKKKNQTQRPMETLDKHPARPHTDPQILNFY